MADKTAAIIKGLKELDPKNGDHWTNDGLPRLDAIKGVSGLKREDVTAAAPHFTKDNPSFEVPDAKGGESTSDQGADASPTAPANEPEAGEQDNEPGGDNEQPPADDEQDDEPDVDTAELDEAELAVAEAKAQLEEAQEAAAAAQKVVHKAQAEHDKLVTIRDSRKRPHQDMEDRMTFIRRQAQMRAERAGASASLLKGLDVNKLDPRSPLDRSMERKKGFGHRPRPQMPLKTGE